MKSFLLCLLIIMPNMAFSNTCVNPKEAKSALKTMLDELDDIDVWEDFDRDELVANLHFDGQQYRAQTPFYVVDMGCGYGDDCDDISRTGTIYVKVLCDGETELKLFFDHD